MSSGPDNTRLGKELAKLEKEDPVVGEAARRLQAAIDSLLIRQDIPRTRFHKSTPEAPCTPYTETM